MWDLIFLWVDAAKAKWTKRWAKASNEETLVEFPEKRNDKCLNNWNEETNYNKSEKISDKVKITEVSGYLFEDVTDPEGCGCLGEPSLRGGVMPTTQGIG